MQIYYTLHTYMYIIHNHDNKDERGIKTIDF